jgi:RHS repeat-associated protein
MPARQRDVGLGLLHFGARFYHPRLGRFISADTLVPNFADPQNLNRYAFVLNNPLKYTDPSGHMVLCDAKCDEGGGAFVAGPNTSRLIYYNVPKAQQCSTCGVLPPVPVVELQPPPNGIPFDPKATWGQLEDNSPDLLARGILSEVGARVLNPDYRNDVIGVGWVMWNRTRSNKYYLYARGSLYQVVVAEGQILGMLGNAAGEPSNAARAANPEAYDSWYGGPGKGRKAYWTAYDIASGILNGTIPDPTNGALQFYDAHYLMDENGNIVLDDKGNKVTVPHEHTHFSCYSGAPSYSIDEIQALNVTC